MNERSSFAAEIEGLENLFDSSHESDAKKWAKARKKQGVRATRLTFAQLEQLVEKHPGKNTKLTTVIPKLKHRG